METETQEQKSLPTQKNVILLSPPQKRKRDFSLLFTFLVGLFAGVAGGILIISLFLNSSVFSSFLFFSSQTPTLPSEELVPKESIDESEYEEKIVNAVKSASPAVVSIIISKDLPVFEKYYFYPFDWEEEFFFGPLIPQYRQKGVEKKEIGGGSGFIVSSDGLILTNKHVVSDLEAEYTVLTNEGQRYQAQVLARDPFQDIAILKVEPEEPLPVLKLGDSDQLEIGQTVIAIGNVLGEFRNSVSVGVISGLGRRITASGGGTVETLEDVIQTDAAINRGNSGGPLLNLKGEVIGINTAMALEAENVGFAIPINKAKRDIEQVKKEGKIIYPFLGVYHCLIDKEMQEKFNLPVDYGAWIGRDKNGNKAGVAVIPDSPAEKAGIKRDDIILEFNGEKITTDNPLTKIIIKYTPGDKVVLKVLRNKEELNLEVVLSERQE